MDRGGPKFPAPPVDPFELYPNLGDGVNQRVRDSEHRIKFWVISGILVNVVAMIMVAVPIVYYFGQASQASIAMSQTVAKNRLDLDALQRQTQDIDTWIATAEQFLITKGFTPPRSRR